MKKQMPVGGMWYEVNPQTIDESFFRDKRSDENEEKVRILILEAFAQFRQNPKRYGRTFETMLPEKTWGSRTVTDLHNLASKYGGHIANWVQLALELAQKICNGTSWQEICNDPDTSEWSRLVVWKNGYCRVVGSSKHEDLNYPSAHISEKDIENNSWIIYSVPKVVRYK